MTTGQRPATNMQALDNKLNLLLLAIGAMLPALALLLGDDEPDMADKLLVIGEKIAPYFRLGEH